MENQMSQKLRKERTEGVGSFPADPSAPQIATKSTRPLFTLEERFRHGNFSIAEVCALKKRSHTGIYQDRNAGLVKIEKAGRKSIIQGPIAKQYIAGLPITDDQGV
jgi:hypothetical protein